MITKEKKLREVSPLLQKIINWSSIIGALATLAFCIWAYFAGILQSKETLSAFILILGSLAFVALGLVLTLLPSSQLMSVVGNLLYMGLAVMGGLWMPISVFPEWMQAIGKCLPTYQLMELIKTFLNKGQVNGFTSVYLILFTLVLFTLVIVFRRHSEVRS